MSGRTTRDPSGTRWLLPGFPRDYVFDLIELVDLAARLGVPHEAMNEALELIESWKLPDGQCHCSPPVGSWTPTGPSW